MTRLVDTTLDIVDSPVILKKVLEMEGRGRQTWYDFLPLSSMIGGVVSPGVVASINR